MGNEGARRGEAKKRVIKDYSGIEERNIKTHELIALNQFLMNGEAKTPGKVAGVVEFVFGGNRVKIFIPSKRVCIAVRLANIIVGFENETERELAKKYLNDTILQRDVMLEVVSTGQDQQQGKNRRGKGKGGKGGTMANRNPNLDGHIYFQGKNVAEYLLANGLARVLVPRYRGVSSGRRPIPKNFERLQNEAAE